MERIKVALRVRPFSYKEKMQNMKPGWSVDQQVDQIKALNQGYCDQVFNFDKIFSEMHTNEHIYHEMCYDVIQKTLEGIDTTIFAYGQTGAGKTHTMLGPPNTFEFNGVIFRSLNDIFKRAINRDEGEEYTLSCSYIEIYNEQVFDLLNKPEEMQHGLQIFEDMEKKKFMVKGKTIVKIESLEEVFKILKYGETNRKYAETYFNHKSSRSHSIFQVQIRVTKITDQGQSFLKESEVNFVDLAGNERLQYEYKIRGKSQKKRLRNKSTNVRGSQKNLLNNDSEVYHNPDFYNRVERQQRMNESKHINKSLFFLTQVIFMTSKGQNQKFVPFRNSPLTKILRSSLGGSSRTVLLLCMSPTLKDFDITLSTLRFGKCAKKIENKIRANVLSSYDKAAIQSLVDSYEKKLQMYNDKLKALENNQVDFVKFWEQFGNFKNDMIKKLMGLEQKKLEQNNYLGLSKEDVTEDTVNKKAGLLFNVPLTDEDILKKRFEGQNCMNCQIQRTVEKFQIQNIPKIFSEFTNKLQQESQIEEFFKAAIDKFKVNLQLFAESNEGLIQQNEHMKDLYEEFITHLIKNYNKVNDELTMFTDQKKIKKLSDEQVDQFYKRLQYIYKIYQEEKIRRKVLREVNMQYQAPEDEDDDKNIFQEQYEELQQSIKNLDTENLEIIKDFNKKYIKEFNEEITQIESSLSAYVDKIYEMNYKIQGKFFEIYQSMERRFKFYEKKLEWISQNFKKGKQQVKQVRKKTAKEGLSQCMSEGNLSNLSNPDFDQSNKKDMKEFLMYNMLNKRMDKIQQFHQNLQEIKQFHQKSLIALPNDNQDFNTQQKDLAKTDADFYSYPQNTTSSEIMTKIPKPIEQPMPIKRTEILQDNLPQQSMKKRESRKLFVQPTETQQEIYDQQLNEQKKQKFDLNNFLNKNHDLDFDIQKFKINTNNNQNNQSKEVFEDNLTPIPSDHKNSFQTQKDNTLLELQDQFENPLPIKAVNYQSEKKESFSPMNYISQSKKKNYTQLMKNYGKRSSKGKVKDLIKK